MIVNEFIKKLSSLDPDSQVYIRYCDINAYGTVDGDDYICLDDVDIYTDKQKDVIIDMRNPQIGN